MSRPHHFLRWALDIFGPIAGDPKERLARFTEEAIELAQADGMERDVLDKIVARVYSREPGLIPKEVGQAYATLELYAESIGLDADHEARKEFDRVRTIPRDEWQRRRAVKVAAGIAG